MKTLYAAVLASAVMLPFAASAAGLFSPSTDASSTVIYDANAGSNDQRFITIDPFANANEAAAKADVQRYAARQRDLANGGGKLVYDANAGSNDERFQVLPKGPTATDLAAKTDAARYAAASSNGALIGTHDASAVRGHVVTFYDANAGSNDPRFQEIYVPN